MNTTDTSPKLWDLNMVADALRVSPHSVRRWASEGRLRRIKLGSRTLFDPADVMRFVEEARRTSLGPAAEPKE